jgi:hypothetical protein
MRGKTIEVRTIKAHPAIMFKAGMLLIDEGAELAETYLRSKGLMAENERLYTQEERITDRGPNGAFFGAAPVSFGVVKAKVR